MPYWLNKRMIAGCLVLVLFYYTYQYFMKRSAAGANHAPPVSVAEVLEREVQQWNEFSGRLVAVNQVEIRPRIAGTVEEIHFRGGAIVNKGDKLFTLDQRTFIADVARAQGDLAQAEAQLKLTTSELARAERLIKDKIISRSEYDTKKNAFHVNKAAFESTKAALETAKINLSYTEIRAPISGRISRAEITVGNLVGTGAHVLATIVTNSPIYVDFEVDENTFLHYAQARLNHTQVKAIPVMMGLATDEGNPHLGYLESFDNHLNSASGTIRVRAIFDNLSGILLPGLYARVKIGEIGPNRRLLITDRAIGTDQDKKFVLVVGKDNKVSYREIKLGAIIEGLRVVHQGLKPGEMIVVNGTQRARPGSEIIPEIVRMDSKETPISVAKDEA